MLKYKLTKETEMEVQYNYYPEGCSDFGVVSLDKKSNTCSIISSSATDKHQRYALKMLKKLREFSGLGSFKPEGILAWY